MHIYFAFYVKVEKCLKGKSSEYITALSDKKIQITFRTTVQFIKLGGVFLLQYLPLIIYTLRERKLCPQTFPKVTVTSRMTE